MQIPRRRFIKFVMFGTGTSIVAGRLWQREVLAICDPTPDDKEAVFKVRLSDYPALSQDFGSVRVGLNPVGSDDRPDGPFHPILINRDDAGNFYVLDCQCRHQGCSVPVYNSSASIRCPCHGSRYGIDGAVISGPAELPLQAYPFEFDGDDLLTIRVLCWGFETRLTVLPGGLAARIKLEFLTQGQITYEVLSSNSLNGPWSLASFAITADGPADQTSITPFAGDVALYLDRTAATGYYAVGMKLQEV